MWAYCVYVLKVASIDGLMPAIALFLLLILCFVMYLANNFFFSLCPCSRTSKQQTVALVIARWLLSCDRQTDRDERRSYVHGVANPRIQDG